MYLKEVKLWNFRKYGNKGESNDLPGLTIQFNKNFNLIIGENDAGKTAIIDAIKITLGTSSEDNLRITENDFHVSHTGEVAREIKIECIFTDLSEEEGGQFLEWLSFDKNGNYELQVRCLTKWHNDIITGERIERIIKAGPEHASSRLEGRTRELIRATYLKPLRDAEVELKPGVRSRLAQILKNHPAFLKRNPSDTHELEHIFDEANERIESFFDQPYIGEKTIKSVIEKYLDQFFHISDGGEKFYHPDFKIVQVKLNEILKKLSLSLSETTSGLGSLNLLFIATELLLLNGDINLGANITLIEEIEAHLHPQAQLRLIKYLQNRNDDEIIGQFILSTHSTTLAASTQLEHIIILSDTVAFPMGSQYTKLEKDDYKFLERFLDSTKANLFFAKGVIFVEGDAENLLLPTLAVLLGRPLHRHGVTVVNIGNTAFSRYAKIFGRSEQWLTENPPLNIPVSIVTDVDVRPYMYYEDHKTDGVVYNIQSEEQLNVIAGMIELEVDEIRHLENIAFINKTELKETLGLLNGRISQDSLKIIFEITKSNVSPPLIKSLKEKKASSIISNYKVEGSNIQVFVAPNWTLEYEIALSNIWESLSLAVHNVKYKNPDSELNRRKFEQLKTDLEATSDIETRAYNLYKPLLEKQVSKAAVAQELAQILQSGREDLKKIIEEDQHFEYLREAIYHVTGGKPHV